MMMGHCNVIVEERVESKSNVTTDNVITNTVSKKFTKRSTAQGFRVSSIFD